MGSKMCDLVAKDNRYVWDLLQEMKGDLKLYSATDITLDEFNEWLGKRNGTAKE